MRPLFNDISQELMMTSVSVTLVGGLAELP